MTKNRHSTMMKLALSLAVKGRGKVHPNPVVGCVVVKGGRIVGQSWHKRFGGPHAEVNALKQAGNRAKGATLYLTLEPCTHMGKTPPCVPAIISSGVKEVFVAMIDPNPQVKGKGIKQLRQAGVRVHVGLEKNLAQAINRPFNTWMTKRRPYVILKLALSLDGKIATKNYDSQWISSKESRDLVHRLRSRSDAVLIGVTTALKDNPTLTSHGKGKNPLRVILDPHLRVRTSLNLIQNNHRNTLILTTNLGSDRQMKELKKRGIRVALFDHVQGKTKVKNILNYLSKENVSQLLIEGGGETAWSFLKAKVVDELFLFLAPIIIGGSQGISSVGGEGVNKVADAFRVKSYHVQPIGRDLLIHGYF